MRGKELYPLKFKEIYKPYLWGGRNLEKLGKSLGGFEIVAESWEVTDHGGDVSVVRNGPLAGTSLRELIERHGEGISPRTSNGRFPIIVKFIDAQERLSVQVHPDDTYARTHESPTELGKNECWYIMDAPPDARLVMGLRRGTTKERFTALLSEDRIDESLNVVPIKNGDFFYIKTGTVHALLEGTMVCEILENSDTTYRLHDWSRVDGAGNPRPLHVEKALDVINFPGEKGFDAAMRGIFVEYDASRTNVTVPLVRGTFFNVDYLNLTGPLAPSQEGSHFHCLVALEGSGTLEHETRTERFARGETVLIPRSAGRYTINTASMKLLKICL